MTARRRCGGEKGRSRRYPLRSFVDIRAIIRSEYFQYGFMKTMEEEASRGARLMDSSVVQGYREL